MTTDGSRDFDWILGEWRVRNSRLTDPLDSSCDNWVEFDGISRVSPALAGWGHIDVLECPPAPGSDAFEALTLRMYEPRARQWSIYWSSSRFPGRLDPPVRGAFDNGLGVFEGDDVVGGKSVRLRFEWRCSDPSAPTWHQSFSFDGGRSWRTNWRMALSRL